MSFEQLLQQLREKMDAYDDMHRALLIQQAEIVTAARAVIDASPVAAANVRSAKR